MESDPGGFCGRLVKRNSFENERAMTRLVSENEYAELWIASEIKITDRLKCHQSGI